MLRNRQKSRWGGKTSARKKLDWGKIEAQDKAGWSAEQIADEMGATVGTIYVGLSKRRKGAENSCDLGCRTFGDLAS